jgi:hypothetical protein
MGGAVACGQRTRMNSTERWCGVALVASPVETEMAGRAWISAGETEPQTTRRVLEAVRRAQSGDREAIGFLYTRYADNVYGYVRSIVHDPHEAEDVTQQVFGKLVRVIGKYEERDVPFFAWIIRVARNLAVDHLHRHRMIPVEEAVATNVSSTDPGGGQPNDRPPRSAR